MKRIVVVVFLCAVAGVALADSFDEAEAKKRGVAVEIVELEHAKKIIIQLRDENSALRIQVAELQKVAASQPASRPAVAAKPVNRVGKKTESLGNVALSHTEMRVGDSGFLVLPKVLEVVDENTCVVEYVVYSSAFRTDAIATWKLLVVGMPTGGLADNTVITHPVTVTITGTKKVGNSTLFVAEADK